MSRWFEPVPVNERTNIGEPVFPIRSTKYSAGYDFYAPYDFTIEPGEVSIVWTDLVARMEDDEVLLLYPRSSLGIKYGIGLANSTGVIDADYLRNIGLPLTNNGNKEVSFTKGEDKLVQGIFFKYLVADNCNSEDERTGGLGSTNKIMKYKVIDPDTEELLQFLYPHKSNCNKGGTNEVCGGCDECLLKQYEYYGYIIEKENNNV